MRLKWLLTAAILVPSSFAQSGQMLPKSLPELAAILPSLVHSKTYQRGPFGDAVDEALRADPASALRAVSICSNNLGDRDPQVRVETLALLHAIAITPQGSAALKPVDDQIAQILAQGDDSSQRLALLIATDLRQSAPESFTSPLEQLVQAPNVSDTIRVRAANALAVTRPTDPGAQNVIVNAIDNNNLAPNLRSAILIYAAWPYAGSIIADNVVRLANTSTDKSIRDTAISAAMKIGPDPVARIKDRLIAIQNDPSESLSSHRITSAALKMLH